MRRAGLVPAAALVVALAAPAAAQEAPVAAPEAPAPPQDARPPRLEVVDLTHPFSEATLYWPTADPFRLEVEAEGTTEGGWWYAANSFAAAEHGGTHIDAPVHFAEGRRSVDEIPLDDLMGQAVVVDVSEAAAADPDHGVGPAAFEAWIAEHGPMPERPIVLLRTGWGSRWPDAEAYLGTARRGPGAVPDLHFPGLSEAGARWLVARGVRAVGIDTASIDRGQSTDFRAHRVLAEANVPVFENVANLDALPPKHSYVVALPMKIEGGTGGPVRIVAHVSVPPGAP